MGSSGDESSRPSTFLLGATRNINTHIRCGDCPIRHRAVCSRCDETELDELEVIKTYQSFRAG